MLQLFLSGQGDWLLLQSTSTFSHAGWAWWGENSRSSPRLGGTQVTSCPGRCTHRGFRKGLQRHVRSQYRLVTSKSGTVFETPRSLARKQAALENLTRSCLNLRNCLKVPSNCPSLWQQSRTLPTSCPSPRLPMAASPENGAQICLNPQPCFFLARLRLCPASQEAFHGDVSSARGWADDSQARGTAEQTVMPHRPVGHSCLDAKNRRRRANLSTKSHPAVVLKPTPSLRSQGVHRNLVASCSLLSTRLLR